MVTILKDVPIPGIEVIPCRLTGPRGIVKSFLLHDGGGLTLVDTGASEADADLIVERIARVSRSPADIRTCLITHQHGDHLGGLAKLRSLGDFAVVAHEQEAEAIEASCGEKVDRLVRDGEELPLFGGIRVVHMPGHSPGNMALYLPAVRTLLAGDSIMSAGGHLVLPPAYLCDDPDLARESVRRLLAMGLDIDSVLVSHGDDVCGTARERLALFFVERRGK